MARHEPMTTELAAAWGLSPEDVEYAIDSALETARDEDGWAGIPDAEKVWDRINSQVERHLSDFKIGVAA